MIEAIAHLYVNFLEPALRVLVVLFVVLLLLSIINFIRDPKAKENFVKTLIGLVFKGLKLLLIGAGAVLKGLLEMLQKSIKVIFAAFRDFFTSKI
jgi:hypothetical protein